MIMGNASSNGNGGPAFSSREAASPIKVIIWNKDPLMVFGTCL
jgi:hypothetical protein